MKKIITIFIIVLNILSYPYLVTAEEDNIVYPIIRQEIDEGKLTYYALELVNNKRSEAGLNPVIIDKNLENLAKDYVKKMANANSASHSVDGTDMRQRAIDFGINLSKDFVNNNFTENIAYGLYSCLEGCIYNPYSELERRINEFANEKSYNGPHYRTIYHTDFNAVGIAIEFIKSSETKGKFFIAYEYAKLDEIVPPANFYDIPSNSKYLESSKYFHELGIIKGYDNFFLPNKPISRIEALKILIDASKIEPITTYKPVQTDLDKDAWYYPYIKTALARKIASGYEDNTFKPDNNISRVEALKIVLESRDISLKNEKHISFSDVKQDDWFSPFIAYSYENSLLDYNGSSFNIDQPITRGDFVKMIYLMRKI